MWLNIGDSSSRMTGVGIKTDSKILLKSGNKIRVNIGSCANSSWNWITHLWWSSYWTWPIHTFESPIDKLASSHFYEIELNEKWDLDSQICDPVQISESILIPILLPDLSNILESVLIPRPVILELESPILSHIPWFGNECGLEFQLLDLDPLLEPISTPEPYLT